MSGIEEGTAPLCEGTVAVQYCCGQRHPPSTQGQFGVALTSRGKRAVREFLGDDEQLEFLGVPHDGQR